MKAQGGETSDGKESIQSFKDDLKNSSDLLYLKIFNKLEALGDKLFEKEAKIHQRCRRQLKNRAKSAKQTKEQLSKLTFCFTEDNIFEIDSTQSLKNH